MNNFKKPWGKGDGIFIKELLFKRKYVILGHCTHHNFSCIRCWYCIFCRMCHALRNILLAFWPPCYESRAHAYGYTCVWAVYRCGTQASTMVISQPVKMGAPSGTEKEGKGQRKTKICGERKRTKETVELYARDGSFIIAFSYVVCATVSCSLSLITMIHSRPRLPFSLLCVPLRLRCHDKPVHEPAASGEGGGEDTMHTNPQTSSPETERLSTNTLGGPKGIRRALHLLGDKFFFR